MYVLCLYYGMALKSNTEPHNPRCYALTILQWAVLQHYNIRVTEANSRLINEMGSK